MAFAGGVALLVTAGQSAQGYGRYTVRKGDTLTSIAKKFGIPLERLASANSAGNRLSIGQVLVIPDAQDGRARGKHDDTQQSATSASARYVVRAGDTLTSIAKRCGVSVDALARANGTRDRLRIGQVLVIPGKRKQTPSSKQTAQPSRSSTSAWHTVAAGETIWTIAKRYGVSPEALAKANSVGDRLRIGQRLRIPGRSSTPRAAVAKVPSAKRTLRTQVRPPLPKADSQPVDETVLQEEAWSPKEPQAASDTRQAVTSSVRSLVVRTALASRGGYYVRGGSGPRSFDCSGFTRYVFLKVAGISLPHSSSAQFRMGKSVSKSELAPGDLVFFRRGGGVGHVGVYIGDGQFVHASNPKRGIRVDSINSGSYRRRFAGARRVLPAD
ncbi:MAG: LysM peptidoglycan-binding domain-containing protein [Armatimonadota bacterium]